MASTFTLNSQTYDGRYLQVILTQTPNAENRRSKVTGTVTSLAGNSTWYATGPTTVNVAGIQRYYRTRETGGTGQSNRNFVGTITEFYMSHDTAGNASVYVELITAIYNSATQTKGGTWTLDSIGAATTACGAPTSLSLNPTVTETTSVLSWSGASAGTNNAITGYEIQYSESTNNSTWGNWITGVTVDAAATSGSYAVTASGTRGNFRRYQIRTRGAAGSSYYSGWKISTNSVRKNIAPSAPTTAAASPTTYSNEAVALTWSGASGGTSAIKGYQIASRTSTDSATWGNWNVLATLTLNASSGSYSPTVSRTPGTYTQFGIWTIDALNVYSAEKISNSIYCNITAATAPTSCSLQATIAESSVILAWSGAAGGAGNAITGYIVQYSTSSNGTSWGSWTAISNFSSTATSGTRSYSLANITRGYYIRFRIQTKGAAGSSYYSGWRTSSNSCRRNILATAPTTFTASPTVYNSGNVALNWSGAVAGTSAIKNFVIQHSTSTDGATWSNWETVTTATTSQTSGTYSAVPSNIAGTITRYRICVTDALDAISEWTVSNTVRKNRPPLAPLIEAPQNGGITYNQTPMALIQTVAELDGTEQTIFVTCPDGSVLNNVDHPEHFTEDGASAISVKTVFVAPTTAPGTYSISIQCRDAHSSGASVTRSFTILDSPFEAIITGVTHVKATHIQRMRTAVNNLRHYYNLSAYAWNDSIIAGKTQVRDWGSHILELRAAVQGVIDKINSYDSATQTFDIKAVDWLPLGTGRPRADVMVQLQALILQL